MHLVVKNKNQVSVAATTTEQQATVFTLRQYRPRKILPITGRMTKTHALNTQAINDLVARSYRWDQHHAAFNSSTQLFHKPLNTMLSNTNDFKRSWLLSVESALTEYRIRFTGDLLSPPNHTTNMARDFPHHPQLQHTRRDHLAVAFTNDGGASRRHHWGRRLLPVLYHYYHATISTYSGTTVTAVVVAPHRGESQTALPAMSAKE
jgi:hypothetical protein